MSHIVIVYATTEGQTRKIAHALSQRLRTLGHQVHAFDAADKPAPAVLDDADSAIIAGSVHANQFQSALTHFLKDAAARLRTLPTAFVSVSLSALGEEDDIDNVDVCTGHLSAQTGWTPGVVHHAAGALRYTQYDFLRRWVMKYIAAKHDLPTKASEDYEFTDWAGLERFADAFANGLNEAA